MKTVVITGVGKGIGRALADKFISEEFFVIGTYYSQKPDFVSTQILLLSLDLSKEESVEHCVEDIKNSGKKIDILVNNAGVLLDEDETRVKVDKLRATLEVNLIGTINFTEQMIPLFSNSGHIVSISSSAGSLNMPAVHDHYPNHYPSYKISKTAINMYTRFLSGKLEKYGIIVSSVHPGWVKTDMGGEEANMLPSEAAQHIYKLAISKVETGQFWFKGEKFPW